jgi:phage portal protein BeeE
MYVTVGDDGFIPAVTLTGSNLDALLRVAVWSYVCMTKISQDVAALPAVVQRKETTDTGQTVWVEDPNHPLNALLQRPLGRDREAPPWSWSRLIEVLSLHIDLAGNGYLQIVGNGRINNFNIFWPDQVTVQESQTGVAQSYTYSYQVFTPDQIVNVMAQSAGSFHTGLAKLLAADPSIQIASSANSRIKYDLTHRLAPGVIFKVQNYFSLTSEQRTEVEDLIASNWSGVENAGKTMVLGSNVDVETAPTSNLGDLPVHRDTARDEILAIWGVPPPIAGNFDAATLQNAQVALRLYWMQTLRPRIGRILDAINTQAVEPIYGPDVRIWFELADNELGLAVLGQRVEVAKMLHRDLDYSTNDSAARVGLDMPRHAELDAMNTQSTIAGRIDIGNGSDTE